MKEKYNECLKLLSKTQEELTILRKKHNKQRTSSANFSPKIDTYICDDESTTDHFESRNVSSINTANSSIWMPSNSNSLATEVFVSLAKDYQARNSNLYVNSVEVIF